MLLWGMTRTRLRVTTTSNLWRRAKNAYSTKGASYGSGSRSYPNPIRSIVIASVISTPALWWLHWKVEPDPSKDQVTRIISQGAYSHLVQNVDGVIRYDGAQLPSNSPCEDHFTHGKFPSPWNQGNTWMTWGVFDGHAGAQTAELLKTELMPFVRHSLSQVKPVSDGVSDGLVQRAVVNAFLNLDDSIIKTALETSQSQESLSEKVKKLAPAYSGSCALLSMYDPSTSTLHVACTGDSRAVLGQKGPDGRWNATPLSVDQTGKNEEEIARLYKEHPGEPDIVKNGRVLGIMVSRAFGDARWKWSLDFQQEIQRKFFGPSPLTPRYPVQTPPYLTAEPVVTSTKLNTGNPSFLIMATDGLWDVLSNQQAVELVGKWLERGAGEQRSSNPEPRYEMSDFGEFANEENWRFEEKRTTVQDDNVAVHLVRNSLGGNHHELVAGRLAFDSPSSRRVRDDITVQVVFFNGPEPKK
ncbi:protein serine/threonine phosphatase 2C [Penicillium cataractarum]|uniref:Protein serine/threonine phosphatase 2C n=1 Tax=Penicillium cataractarum TaxID=2100454 RepID=A0A9W9UXS0_9EURO|nr:protein serine/threonine phosphatase 2C [Penicillium cataractarum]KAJ5359050.1 protein serine/threonine phosphatase 2C [Penicillium cataractarum]